MKRNSFGKGRAKEPDMLTPFGYRLVADNWIFQNVPCVLVYKDGFMDIYPIEQYTDYELTLLQRDSSYKSPWIPIRYGSFIEMQKCMYEIAHEGLGAICAKPLDVK